MQMTDRELFIVFVASILATIAVIAGMTFG